MALDIRSDVSPGLSEHNPVDYVRAHAIVLRQMFLRFATTGSALPYSKYLHGSEFAIPVTLASSEPLWLLSGVMGITMYNSFRKTVCPVIFSAVKPRLSPEAITSFTGHISHIVELLAKEEMIGTRTRRVVATMAHLVSFRNRPNEKFIREAMSGICLTRVSHSSVATGRIAVPFPAFFRMLYGMFKKAVFETACEFWTIAQVGTATQVRTELATPGPHPRRRFPFDCDSTLYTVWQSYTPINTQCQYNAFRNIECH